MIRPPLLTPSQRANLLSFCAAMYGLAIAIAAYPLWLRPAPPDQLPGYMTALHLDAHASFRFFASVVVLTLAMPFALRRVVDLLTRADTRSWARNGAAAAMVVALWYASVARDLAWTVLPGAAAIAACVAFRRMDARFSRRDAVLLPTIGTLLIALIDYTGLSVERSLLAAVTIVFAIRLTIVLLRREDGLRPSLCFAFAPLGVMLQSHFFARDQRYAGWPALLIAIVTPFVLRLLMRDTPAARRRLRAAIVFAVYPLAAYGYASANSLVTAETRPRVDFFEVGQHLAPANEVFRGEKPYRDIVPPHGLIQDALLDVAMLRHGPVRIGTVLKARGTLSGVMAIAGYAIAAGATGSADVAVFSVFGAALLGFSTGNVRFLPSIASLALAVFALRRRSRPLLAAAAAIAVIAILTSVEFGVYASIAVVIAALMFSGAWRDRTRALAAAAAGALVAFAVAAIVMLAGGYFVDFIRVTLFEVLTLGPVYVLNPFTPPPGFDRPFPEMLTSIFGTPGMLYFVWIASLLGLGAMLAHGIRSRGLRRRQVECLALVASWVVLVGISYAERHHLYFHFAVMPLVTAFTWLLLRARNAAPRLLGGAIVAMLIVVGTITSHISVVGIVRHTHGPMDPAWREVGLPRAQGALFRDKDIAVIDTIYRYANAHLRGDDTFFDFTNRALLYFLLDKNIPVRQIEPAFYETEERQREVIALIQNNPWVKFAIVPSSPGQGVDNVGNEVRAPLVWKYLRENFEPDFHEGAVEIWKRK
jgi:hypothetical protein